MTSEYGADPAFVASQSSRQGVSPLAGINPAYEEWREALATFCEHDGLAQTAENIRRGYPLDYLNVRMIDALKAALDVAPVTAFERQEAA